jgi:heat shock protein HspQ
MPRHDVLAATDPVPAPPIAHARFSIGDVVRHRVFEFRGVIFDVDPVFANSEEWYQAIPEEIRPRKDQPFYHLLAENTESSYVAYVSQQNLVGGRRERSGRSPGDRRHFRRLCFGALPAPARAPALRLPAAGALQGEIRAGRAGGSFIHMTVSELC